MKKLKINKFLIIGLLLFCFTNNLTADKNRFVILESKCNHQFNPQLSDSANDSTLLYGLYEGLFSYNPVSLAPQYAIASEYRVSRDKKRWSIKINPEACFSNGEKITAKSVRKSFVKLLGNKNSPYASLLDVIKNAYEFRNGKCTEDDLGIYVLGDLELSIHLVSPANYLPKVLCHSAFSIVHDDKNVFSGAYCLDSIKENQIVLKKNPYYWDKNNVLTEFIEIVQNDDAKENSYLYNVGLVDWVTDSVDSPSLIKKNDFNYNAMFATSYMFFKNSKNKASKKKSVWDKKAFRAALFEAMPWDELRANYYVPAPTFVYPLSDYPQVEGFSFTDMIEAKQLMKEARQKNHIKEDVLIPLVFDVPQNFFADQTLESIKKNLKEIGVDLQINEFSYLEYYDKVASSDSDLFCYSWIGDFADPLAFLELFRSKSSLNASGWNNKKYDELIQKAAEVSSEERNVLLATAEEILLDDCIVIPIQHSITFNVINLEEIGGWAANAFDIHPLKYIFKKESKSTVPNIVMNK